MLDFINWAPDVVAFHVFGFPVRWYSLCWCAALFAGYLNMKRLYKKQNIDEKYLEQIFLYCFFSVLIGARLGHCLFYEPAHYLANPLDILKIWEGGLASHGGVMGIIIAVWLYSKRVTKKSMLWTFDRVIVPTGFVAAAIRIGNLMNHEIYGGVTDQPWGFRFIENIGAWKAGIAEPIFSQPSHPTQIYEALVYLLVFAITMYLFWKTDAKKKQGLLIGIAMIIIFASRFFIEYIKHVQVDSEEALRQSTGLILGQWLSIPFVIWGVWLVWNAFRNSSLKEKKVEKVEERKEDVDSNFITK